MFLAQCPELTRPPNSLLAIRCNNGRRVGSRCTLGCAPGLDLVGGIRLVTCSAQGPRWTRDLRRFYCGKVYRFILYAAR